MKPLYLKFESEAQAKAVLFTDIPHPEFGPVMVANFANVDVIGEIMKDDAPLPGWHVNVMLLDSEDGEALEPFAVAVKTPSRVWAQ